jgi:hypothetical protein
MDLHAEITDGLRDAAGAWRFVRLFASSFARPLRDAGHAGNRPLEDGDSLPAAQFRSLPMPAYALAPGAEGLPVRWFEGFGPVLRADAETWLWVAAPSGNALAAVRNALPGDWLGGGQPTEV